MKKIIILIIAITVIGLIIYSRREQTPSGSPSDRPETDGHSHEVIYTDSGYDPKELTVDAGETVTFKNDSSLNLMWVASDPHPVHSALPAFDALKGSASSQDYSFTFMIPGTYGYHNHLVPGHGGRIIVK